MSYNHIYNFFDVLLSVQKHQRLFEQNYVDIIDLLNINDIYKVYDYNLDRHILIKEICLVTGLEFDEGNNHIFERYDLFQNSPIEISIAMRLHQDFVKSLSTS